MDQQDPQTPPPESQDARGLDLANFIVQRLKLLGVVAGKDEAVAKRIVEDLAPAILDRLRRYDGIMRHHVAQLLVNHAQSLARAAGDAAETVRFEIHAVDLIAEAQAKRELAEKQVAEASRRVAIGR